MSIADEAPKASAAAALTARKGYENTTDVTCRTVASIGSRWPTDLFPRDAESVAEARRTLATGPEPRGHRFQWPNPYDATPNLAKPALARCWRGSIFRVAR